MKEEQLIIFEQRTIPAFDMNVRKTFHIHKFYYIITVLFYIYWAMNIFFLLSFYDFHFLQYIHPKISGQIHNGKKVKAGTLAR